MDFPIDPTQNEASPQELIQALPTRAARRRVLQAAEISIDVDDKNFESFLDELSEVELRRALSELRFAGEPTVYYYRVDGLHRISSDDALGRANNERSTGAYGSDVETAIRDHDRVYVVCQVPKTGSQTQLTLAPDDRETTVATFKPRSQLLAVRADDADTADATASAVSKYFEMDGAERISFLDAGIRGRFEDACVDGYSTLQLRDVNSQDNTREIEIRSKELDGERVSDVRHDPIVEDLIRRSDTELVAATGLVSVPTVVQSPEDGEPLHPRVTIGFSEGSVSLEQFVPESILVATDDLVRESL
ncbi:hypothetical protein [Haloarchaeobius sp. HRN-SO-5]|uniref:hypothetical protein n=1 Tax=Haloarchaeobius sp. HRN-SO-5 TaxID=3446118 RepID=UPI003EBF2878